MCCELGDDEARHHEGAPQEAARDDVGEPAVDEHAGVDVDDRPFDGRHGSSVVGGFNSPAERSASVAAGQSAHVEFPVQWGSYRVEVYDPATKLTTVFPFFAGYSWDDENLGKEARPDKVKLQLDKARYRAGDTMKVTVTPPHDGPGVLLVESDHLLYTKNIDAKAGSTFEIPVTKDWERHDVYVTALVFRGGEAAEHSTPARAMGVEYVAMDRNDRRIPLKLDAPALMRPGNPLEVGVQATGLAGQKAFVTLSAVDQGVLNITNYPVPDAWTWLFAKRALGVEAYDLYSRIIEAMDGAEARLRYGGDMSGAALPKAARLNPKVQIVDLFSGPVAFDAHGKATLHVDVPDFNGSLRLAALAYTDSRYGNADGAVTVRAPLVVEPSTPRVMAAGDKAMISLDLKNLSGKDGTAKVSVKGGGLITVDKATQSVPLKDGAGTTLHMPVTAQAGAAVATVDIHAELNDYSVDRHFEFAVRPAWPETVSTTPLALEAGKPERFGAAAIAGLLPATVHARLTLSTLPPLPYASALRDMLRYPYGCIEQTTSKGYATLILDGQTAKALGAQVMSDAVRKAAVDGALSRIASYQASNGHFSFWGGTSPIADLHHAVRGRLHARRARCRFRGAAGRAAEIAAAAQRRPARRWPSVLRLRASRPPAHRRRGLLRLRAGAGQPRTAGYSARDLRQRPQQAGRRRCRWCISASR